MIRAVQVEPFPPPSPVKATLRVIAKYDGIGQLRLETSPLDVVTALTNASEPRM